MPPEWQQQERYWLAWPSPRPGRTAPANHAGDVEALRDATVDLARQLSGLGPVTMIANPAEVASVSIRCGPGVGTMIAPHSDIGLRRYGPGFLVNGHRAVALRWPGSDGVTDSLLSHLGVDAVTAPGWLLGGYVDVDGNGAGLVSTALLEQGDKDGIEQALAQYLAVDHPLWVDARLEGDPSGLVHNAARFVAPGVVIAASDEKGLHPWLNDNIKRLVAATDAQGRPLRVIAAPLPKRRQRRDGRVLPMSYSACLVAKGLVLLPAFEDPRDQEVFDRTAAVLPDHTIALFPARDLASAGRGLTALVLPQPSVNAIS